VAALLVAVLVLSGGLVLAARDFGGGTTPPTATVPTALSSAASEVAASPVATPTLSATPPAAALATPTVAPATPTPTPAPTALPTPSATPSPSPTSTPVPTPTPVAWQPTHRVVATTPVNLRAGPSTTTAIVTTLAPATVVAFLGDQQPAPDAVWMHVRIEDGRDGWVRAIDLQPISP
jgi:uncharacterized protein YgiM (DUF1202 family)